MRMLFVGDVVGRPGREALEQHLAKVQWKYKIDFTVVNGENASGRAGLNKKGLAEMLTLGIDAVTMGNHVWDNKDIYNFIDREERLLRPANLPAETPGRGWRVFACGDKQVAVINLLGRVYMGSWQPDCPFHTVDAILAEVQKITPYIFVDWHAEATSEKVAMGWHLDGRVSAVSGTHTHVQTNDARILPKGTGYLTDVGMTGPRDSVLGLDPEPVIKRFITQMPCPYGLAAGENQFNAVVFDLEDTGKTKNVETISFVC